MKRITVTLVLAVSGIIASTSAFAAKTPAIVMTASNRVPACVTPERLMDYVKKRNRHLDKRFADVASYYQHHGESLGIRWDYAFFQMLVETNWLKYRAPNGRKGDVDPSQNNFAGLGATGHGAPGERFPDVSTGVLAHLQHVQMYSGTRIEHPAAERTRKVQEWLLEWSQSFDRPVTFTDLTRKWSPGDRGYSDDIEFVAKRFRKRYCTGDDDIQTASIAPKTPAQTICKVWKARYSNAEHGLLIRSVDRRTVNYTALAVADGLEKAQADAFISQYAKGGSSIAKFNDYEQALNRAFELCPASG